MNYRSTWLAAIAVAICVVDASAEGAEPHDMDFNAWYCVDSAKGLSNFKVEGGGVRLGDVIISEGKTLGAPTIHISATSTNRSDTTIVMTISYVGLSDDQPVFALSTSEFAASLATNQSRVIEQSVFASPGTLASAKRHCLRVDAFR